MRRWPGTERIAALAVTGVLAAVSGCGAGQPAPSGQSAGSGSGSTSVNAGGGSGDPAPGPDGGAGAPVPVVRGAVSVTPDAGEYRMGAVIKVTVANGTERPVYTEDFKTACTIVTLQRRDGADWTDMIGCALGRPTETVRIGPGLGRTAELDPASIHLNNTPGGPGFGTGSYRLMFTYRLDPAPGTGNPSVVYSEQFAVR